MAVNRRGRTLGRVVSVGLVPLFVAGSMMSACTDDDGTVVGAKDASTRDSSSTGRDATPTSDGNVSTEDSSTSDSSPSTDAPSNDGRANDAQTTDAQTTDGQASDASDSGVVPFCQAHAGLQGVMLAVATTYIQEVWDPGDCHIWNYWMPIDAEAANGAGFTRYRDNELIPWMKSFWGCPAGDAGVGDGGDAGPAPRAPVALVPYKVPANNVSSADYAALVEHFINAMKPQSAGFTDAERTRVRAELMAAAPQAVNVDAGGFTNPDTADPGCAPTADSGTD